VRRLCAGAVGALLLLTGASPTNRSDAAIVRPVIAAAGDIACSPQDPAFNGGLGTGGRCQMKATSDLLVNRSLAAVLALGDEQYHDGSLTRFARSYDPTWGRVKAITRPVPGDHEYVTAGAAGYFAYFTTQAGDPRRGYYSYDVGGWHMVALNSNCAAVGGCHLGSPQETWLRDDLARHPRRCTLAYGHHPRFSSGAAHGSDPAYTGFWRALYDAGADVVLSGDDHTYERFRPQDPWGRLDLSRGIRQFVVGTGGRSLSGFGVARPNSRVRASKTFGVLTLTLRPASFDWRFIPTVAGGFTDAGTAACH
jgi:hypothetical protein